MTTEEETWRNLAHFFADELLERWHDGDLPTQSAAAEWMGLSFPEYAMWVEGRYAELETSLRAREA